MTPDLGFVHRFLPGRSGRTLILLHGTGGDENDLIPLGKQLAPHDALLSPRGQVLENGMPRYFRRLAEGVFDEADRHARTEELASFLRRAAEHYELDLAQAALLGYSNGANIAWSLLLQAPGLVRRAALWRAMMPQEPSGPLPDLAGSDVLMTTGQQDPIVSASQADRVEKVLLRSGASVRHERLPASHGLSQADLVLTQGWLASP